MSKKPVHLKEAPDKMGLAIGGGSYRIIISGKETDNNYAVIEMLVPPGGGPGPHAHADFNESFYVVEGSVEFQSEDGVVNAAKGAFVDIPKGGIVHGFKNKSSENARLWCTVVPAGLEAFFAEIGAPVEFGTFIKPPPMTKEVMDKIIAVGEKYGQQIFPPDYFEKKQ